jgi:hypothetical protein
MLIEGMNVELILSYLSGKPNGLDLRFCVGRVFDPQQSSRDR